MKIRILVFSITPSRKKRHTQQVHSIRNTAGLFVYDNDVSAAFVEHLKTLMGSTDGNIDPDMPSHLFQNTLSVADANLIIQPITDLDIRNAMFSIGNEKAPGPDGFLLNFLKLHGISWVRKLLLPFTTSSREVVCLGN